MITMEDIKAESLELLNKFIDSNQFSTSENIFVKHNCEYKDHPFIEVGLTYDDASCAGMPSPYFSIAVCDPKNVQNLEMESFRGKYLMPAMSALSAAVLEKISK